MFICIYSSVSCFFSYLLAIFLASLLTFPHFLLNLCLCVYLSCSFVVLLYIDLNGCRLNINIYPLLLTLTTLINVIDGYWELQNPPTTPSTEILCTQLYVEQGYICMYLYMHIQTNLLHILGTAGLYSCQ